MINTQRIKLTLTEPFDTFCFYDAGGCVCHPYEWAVHLINIINEQNEHDLEKDIVLRISAASVHSFVTEIDCEFQPTDDVVVYTIRRTYFCSF